MILFSLFFIMYIVPYVILFLEYLMSMTASLDRPKLTGVLVLVLRKAIVLNKNIAARFCMHSSITSSSKNQVNINFYLIISPPLLLDVV